MIERREDEDTIEMLARRMLMAEKLGQGFSLNPAGAGAVGRLLLGLRAAAAGGTAASAHFSGATAAGFTADRNAALGEGE